MIQQATLPRQPAPQLDIAGLAKQAFQPWADAYETWRSGVSDLLQQPPKPKTGCNCAQCAASRCEPDPCACRCCVSDADLVLEARLGERRVISLVIENHWRRARDIELELSSWTKTTDGAAVTAEILSPTALTLAPCAEATVVIGVTVGATDASGNIGTISNTTGTPPSDTAPGDQRVIPDVTGCAVSYADLRIKGCDVRSVRIAVAVLPRDCDAYHVDCACGCC